jgi:Protein of unknown function (DUF2690)
LVISATLLGAQPSMAASCSGSGCSGKNPQTEGCSSGAVTKKEYSDQYETIEIRYSSTCRAWWARARLQGFNPTCFYYANIIQDINGRESARQRLVTPHYTNCEGGQSWTYMIGDIGSGDHYDACADVGYPSSPPSPDESSHTHCTGRI